MNELRASLRLVVSAPPLLIGLPCRHLRLVQQVQSLHDVGGEGVINEQAQVGPHCACGGREHDGIPLGDRPLDHDLRLCYAVLQCTNITHCNDDDNNDDNNNNEVNNVILMMYNNDTETLKCA